MANTILQSWNERVSICSTLHSGSEFLISKQNGTSPLNSFVDHVIVASINLKPCILKQQNTASCLNPQNNLSSSGCITVK